MAGILKVKDEAPSGATVVCVLTGNELKDPEIALAQATDRFYQGITPNLNIVAQTMGLSQ